MHDLLSSQHNRVDASLEDRDESDRDTLIGGKNANDQAMRHDTADEQIRDSDARRLYLYSTSSQKRSRARSALP